VHLVEEIHPDTHRPKSTCRGVRRPDAICLTLVDSKKRRRFDNRRPEGYCGAHLCLVRIRTAGTGSSMSPRKRGPEVYAVAPIDRYALPHSVQNANALTLRVWKTKCPDTRRPKSTCRGVRRLEEIHPVTRRLEEICLDYCRLEEICLDTQRLDGKCPGTRRLEEICLDTLRLEGKCPSTRHPEGICPGRRHPNSTCLDTRRLDGKCPGTRRLKEICPDTLRLEGKMPWH